MTRFKHIFTVLTFALLALSLPLVASAQYRNDRNNRNDDYNRNQNYNRNLRATVVNLKNRSSRFERTLDRALDRSRYDDRRGEDRINDVAENFARAAKDLEDEYNNRRDYRDSADEARRVLQYGAQLDRAVSRLRLDRKVRNEWNQIRQDLQTLGNAYSYNGARNDNYNNGRYDRDDDDDDDNDNYQNRNKRDKRDKRNKRNNRRGNYNPY